MGTTINKKDVATTGSGHVSPGPLATSLVPPTPPAGLVPAPFVYVAESKSATQTSDKLTVGGKPVLVEGSAMDVMRPGNQPAAPPGTGDILTHAICGKAVTTSGSSRVKAGGKGVCTTGDSTVLNVPSPCGKVAQSNGKLIAGADYHASGADYASMAAVVVTEGEPVAVVSGEVVDDMVDLALPGLIPVEWKRLYCSGRHKESTPLGRGGWTHALHQWIEVSAERITLRNDDGRNVLFSLVEPRGETFHRCKRLFLRRGADESFEVLGLDTRLTRRFAPLAPGGRAMLREIQDAWGNRVELVYDGERLIKIVDTAGRELRLTHDAAGRIARVEAWAQGEAHQHFAYVYDDEGDLARAIDALGHAEVYGYDAWHRMVEKALRNGVRFFYAYDPATGRCCKTWGDGGLHTVEFDVDLAKGVTLCHGNEEPRKYTWNEQGAVLREETYDGTYRVEKVYDDDLYVLAEFNAAGETTAHEYDTFGNRVKTTDPAGNVTRWRYDDDHLPIEQTGADGLVTRYTHDRHGAVVGVTYPSGETFSLAYDGKGRLTSIVGAEGRLVAYAYDEQHNLVEQIDARGAAWRYAYDPLGRPVARTDPLGNTTRLTCDALGRPVTIHYPDGTDAQLAYDALGNVARFTDALGRVTTMEYAGTGSLVRQTTPDGQSWHFAYDGLERLTRIKNPMCETYEFEYDRAGRVREEKTFDERRLRYAYSTANRLARIQHPDGTWREFLYDLLGNIVEERSPHGAFKIGRDRLGRLTSATVVEYSGKTVVAFERDALGRVVAERQGERTIRYEHDVRGRRIARVLSGGATTRYYYDPAGAPIGIEHDGRKILIERDALGRETRKHVYKSGVDVLRSYDEMDRLIEQQVTAPSPGAAAHELLSQRTWRYDAAGRVRSISDKRWGTSRYQYDSLGQLIEAHRGNHHEVFDYDPTGSLQNVLASLKGLEKSIPWHVATGNVLKRTKEAEFEYDPNRRRRKKRDLASGEVTEYLWDCRDRLREVRLPDGRRVLYTYDAFGRRVRKEIVPKLDPAALAQAKPLEVHVVEFLWDGDALAAEFDSERGVRIHVHEPGTLAPMLQAEQGEVFLVVNDHLGMPKELVDEDGKVAWAAAHSAWGRVLDVATEGRPRERRAESPFRLLGQYADEETGLCCTRFRYFDAQHGRWLSPDPLGIEGGRNLLAFDGAPTVEVDPLGLACEAGYVRIRHYTNAKGLQGIKESGVIRARDQNKVFAEPARGKPLSPRDAEDKYKIKKGHGRNIVETDIPAGRVSRVFNPTTKDYELEIEGDVPLLNPTFQKR